MEQIEKILESVKTGCDFRKSEDFIEDGLLDSLDVFALIEALEKAFGIEIQGEDITPENFKSCNAIEKLIKSYKRR